MPYTPPAIGDVDDLGVEDEGDIVEGFATDPYSGRLPIGPTEKLDFEPPVGRLLPEVDVEAGDELFDDEGEFIGEDEGRLPYAGPYRIPGEREFERPGRPPRRVPGPQPDIIPDLGELTPEQPVSPRRVPGPQPGDIPEGVPGLGYTVPEQLPLFPEVDVEAGEETV